MKFVDACDKAEVKNLRIRPVGAPLWWELLPSGPGLRRFMIKNPNTGEFKTPSLYPCEIRGEWEVEPEPEPVKIESVKKTEVSEERFDRIVAKIREMLFAEKKIA